MKKQLIRLTESDLHNIIEQSVKRIIKEDFGNYGNEKANRFDRANNIQNLKAELGDIIEDKINEYGLSKDEVMQILNTMLKYFNSYQY